MAELTPQEREFLSDGVLQWAGPAHPSDALAVALGVENAAALHVEGLRVCKKLRSEEPLSREEKLFALASAEIMFASDRWGAGVEWQTVTGHSDAESIEMIRSLQRKLVGLGPWPEPR